MIVILATTMTNIIALIIVSNIMIIIITLRPVRLLRVWISEGLTQGNS